MTIAAAPPGAPRAHGAAEPETLGGFVADAAKCFGPRPALTIKPSFRTQVTTYAGLYEAAWRFARLLQARGIGPGERVVLWAPNSPDWVVAYFGCQLAGAVVVPLDVASAPDFVAAVARATRARLAVVSRLTARQDTRIGAPTLGIEELGSSLRDGSPTLGAWPPAEGAPRAAAPVGPDDVCEIMFTSGTTGKPKGVMLSHRNILANMHGADEVIAADPSFHLLSLLPLSHMLEQTVGLLIPLAGGARIAYPTSRQPGAIFRAMAESQITMMIAVPQAMELILNAVEREVRRQGREATLRRLLALAERLPMPLRRLLFHAVHAQLGGGLRTIISGGGFLDPALAHRWELLGVTVLQGYGATETAPIITADRPGQRVPGAVGYPLRDVELRIAADGEIEVRGPNVFKGYWEDPPGTAAALAEGWYHTGDLGWLDSRGYLHLKGRKTDRIVLANGMNVYPEDVESELNREPGVAEAVVVGLERDGEPRIHAVLLMRDVSAATAAVRAANARLASHQQIAGFTVWPFDDFPRTTTLKVKKAEVLAYLRQQDVADPAPAGAPAQAATEPASLPSLIAEIAAAPAATIRPEQALGADLGLDSLGWVALLSAVESELGVAVDEELVSSATTVGELERLIEAGRQDARRHSSFAAWPLTPLAVAARELLLQALVFPAYHACWRVRVVGREGIAGLHEPALIAANHNFGVGDFGLDPGIVWMALPRALRLRAATAGAEHAVFDPPIRGRLARLLNVFPISKEGNVRASLEHIGRLLDLGWSVIIFPEGKLTPGGPMQPFMGGTGLMAIEGRAPVVPARIVVEQASIVQGRWWPPRGALTVTLGAPLHFAPDTAAAEATARVEAAVRALE